jgi:hypothetical protein
MLKEMQAGNPPAVPPRNLTGNLAQLWSLLAWCWTPDPLSRPHGYILSSHLADMPDENYVMMDLDTDTWINHDVPSTGISTVSIDSSNQDPIYNAGFTFSQPNIAMSPSPFNQTEALPPPALGRFALLPLPATSPFSAPIEPDLTDPSGPPPSQKRPSENQGSDDGSLAAGEWRWIAPMSKPRRARTQAETRNALAKAHGRG